MRISRVHLEALPAIGEEVALDKRQSHYLRNVLRLTTGAAVICFDGQHAIDYNAQLIVDGKEARIRILSSTPLDNESPLHSEVIQGLARSDHVDWVIQKTTELGVKVIRIFNAERSQSPIKSSHRDKKLMHWRATAASACEQCGRAVIPQIYFHRNLERALTESKAEVKLVLDFSGQPILAALQQSQSSVAILLGPEGGLSASEIVSSTAAGCQPTSLGKRVLRTETAAVAALAIVQSTLGDLG